MSKHIYISIPEPCTQDWDAMIPNQHGKYCDSCKKTVIDFTEMSDTQILNFIQNNKSQSCGIFHNDQLEKQILIPRKPFPWLKYFFTITLPAFLISQKVWAQKKISKTEITLTKPTFELAKVIPVPKIKDSVELLDEIIVKATTRSRREYTAGGIFTHVTHSYIGKCIKSKNSKEIITNDINIYPNPIIQNSKMNISWNIDILNNQFVEIFNANGALIKREIIAINTKSKTAFFILSSMVKGLYIIRITDTKTLVKMSKEFIVI